MWKLDTFLKSYNWTTEQNAMPKLLRSYRQKTMNQTSKHSYPVGLSILPKFTLPKQRESTKILEVNYNSVNEKTQRMLQTCSSKNNNAFIKFDISEFYPSISETILRTSICFTEDHAEITNKEKIICHCRKSLLFQKNGPWKKKDSDSCFDVAMGSYESMELCHNLT